MLCLSHAVKTSWISRQEKKQRDAVKVIEYEHIQETGGDMVVSQ